MLLKSFGLCLCLLLTFSAQAQSNDRIRQTWKAPDMSALWALLNQESAAKADQARAQTLRFTPAADSGVTKALADAFGSSVEERGTLTAAFGQIKQAYEAEAARAGKSNNLAAAMTFFISANVVTYHQTEVPSDADSAKLFAQVERAMARIPAFAQMSGAEKHKMHDWLVCMGGFALMNYMDAKQRSDAQTLSTIKQFADYAMQLALGVEARKVSLSGDRLHVEDERAGPVVSNKIVGAWTTSSAQGGGHMRLRYIFNSDGTYSFKSERNHTAQRWWTMEETGNFSIDGNALTISPKTSKATLRNLNGVVQETRSNPIERVTYKWTTHYFEGIGETNLVLEPPQATSRDGIPGSNSLFPKAYLYTQGDRLEWRF